MSLFEKSEVLRRLVEDGVTVDASGEERELGMSTISTEAAEALYRTVLHERPDVCIEVGLAFGMSALAILTALEEAGNGRLISVDPFQEYSWGDAGVLAVRRAGLDHRHAHVSKLSQLALPALIEQGVSATFGYIDGGHRFDEVLLDFFYMDKLLPAGGVVAFNDSDLPAVARALSFLQTHRRYEELNVLPFRPAWMPARKGNENDRYFRKLEQWEPPWDYYEAF